MPLLLGKSLPSGCPTGNPLGVSFLCFSPGEKDPLSVRLRSLLGLSPPLGVTLAVTPGMCFFLFFGQMGPPFPLLLAKKHSLRPSPSFSPFTSRNFAVRLQYLARPPSTIPFSSLKRRALASSSSSFCSLPGVDRAVTLIFGLVLGRDGGIFSRRSHLMRIGMG